MKKVLILFLLAITILPTFGANWVQIDTQGKLFIDSTSRQKESEYGRYNAYSVWIKALNNGNKGFKNAEILYNKKIWYEMHKWIFDCNSNEVKVEQITIYDTEGYPINMLKSAQWDSIIPDSGGDIIKHMVCIPQ